MFVARSGMASDKAGRRVDRDRTDPSHKLLDGLLTLVGWCSLCIIKRQGE
jgi:hypothetical protein